MTHKVLAHLTLAASVATGAQAGNAEQRIVVPISVAQSNTEKLAFRSEIALVARIPSGLTNLIHITCDDARTGVDIAALVEAELKTEPPKVLLQYKDNGNVDYPGTVSFQSVTSAKYKLSVAAGGCTAINNF